MDLIASIPLIGPLLSYAIPFLLVLSVVVAVHEYGHYIVGRWCGIKARVFSVGFGKVIWSRMDRHGTRWQFAAVPLGGYVQFVGDMNPASAGAKVDDLTEEERAHAFHEAALWRRALTVSAGPVANFLLSIFVFACVAFWQGAPSNEPEIASIGEAQVSDHGFEAGDRVLNVGGESVETFGELIDALHRTRGEPTEVVLIRDGEVTRITSEYLRPARITDVVTTGAAATAGVQPGDLLISIDGNTVSSASEVQEVGAALEHGKEIDVVVDRMGDRMTFSFTPDIVTRPHPFTGEEKPFPQLGVQLGELGGLEPRMGWMTPWDAVWYGVLKTVDIVKRTVLYINQMLFHGADPSQLSGPIGIAKISGEAAKQGADSIVVLIAFLSTAIGFVNLLPIPVLDGGHLMFYAAEALRGRPLGEKWQEVGTMIGLSLVLLLMVFVTYNDILKL